MSSNTMVDTAIPPVNNAKDAYKPKNKAKRQKALKCPSRRDEINALCQPDGRRHMLTGFIPHFSIYALWIYLQLTIDNIWVNSLLSCLLGWQLYSLFVLQHDCMHGSAFKKDFYNRWVGRFYTLTFIMTFTVNRSTHMRHHAHISDPERDPDEYYFADRLYKTWFRIWRYLEWYTMIALTRYGKTVRNKVIMEQTFNLAFVGVIHYVLYSYGMLEKALYITWLPLAVAAFVINPITRGYEHSPITQFGEDDERKLDMSVNTITVTNSIYNLFSCNIGYHAEHHAYPRCPFYNLPKLHQIFQEEQLRYLVAPLPLYKVTDPKNLVKNLTINPQNP